MAKKRRKTKRQLREERQKKLRKRKRKRIILLTVEIIILAALLVAAYGIFKLGKLDYNVLNKKKLEVYKDTGEYTNIALFGLDSRNNELDLFMISPKQIRSFSESLIDLFSIVTITISSQTRAYYFVLTRIKIITFPTYLVKYS